jgi:hypothetical protein
MSSAYFYLRVEEIKAKLSGAAGVDPTGVTVLDSGVLLITFAAPLDLSQKEAVDAFLSTRNYVPSADSDIVLRDPRNLQETVTGGNVTQRDWFEDADLTVLARRDVLTWATGNKLVSTKTTLYYTDGSAGPTWTDTYTTANGKRITRRT